MRYPENFICLSYKTIDFLIPEKKVVTAGCSGENLIYMGEKLLTVDFDKALAELNFLKTTAADSEDKKIKTSIIMKNEGLVENAGCYALLTSSDCRVSSLTLDVFSLFEEPWASLKKNGLLACTFYDDKIAYLIDCNLLLGKLKNERTVAL